MMLFLMLYPRVNRPLLNHMCFLMGTGFLILGRMNLSQAVRQLIIAAVSLILSMWVPQVMKKWGRLLKKSVASVRGSRACGAARRSDPGTGDPRIQNHVYDSRHYLSAVGACEAAVRFFSRGASVGGRFPEKADYRRRCGGGACSGARSVQGSGKRAHFLPGLCHDGFFAVESTAIWRSERREAVRPPWPPFACFPMCRSRVQAWRDRGA